MADEVINAIKALELAKQTKLAEAAVLGEAIEDLQKKLLTVATGQLPQSFEYQGLGIVDAAKRWLTEVGEPRSTREIADALQERGLVTRSKNFTATVYATLTNSGDVKRTSEGTWDVKGRGQ